MAEAEPDQVAQEGGAPNKRTLRSAMAEKQVRTRQGKQSEESCYCSRVMTDVEPEKVAQEVPKEPETTPFERKRKDRDEKELRRLYDHRKMPFEYHCDSFVYKNKAQIRFDKAMAKYNERMRHLTAFDAIAPPQGRELFCGGVRPLNITKKNRPLLISLCELALGQYNEEENQGANFVFHDLVKSTWAATAGDTYYITFQAKTNDVTKTFWARVWNRLPAKGPPVVQSCSLKPEA